MMTNEFLSLFMKLDALAVCVKRISSLVLTTTCFLYECILFCVYDQKFQEPHFLAIDFKIGSMLFFGVSTARNRSKRAYVHFRGDLNTSLVHLIDYYKSLLVPSPSSVLEATNLGVTPPRVLYLS
jgi:hypothetical protein